MSSAPEVEARQCPDCGLIMAFSRGVYFCQNADGIQPQEKEIDPNTGDPFPRKKTGWDYAHENAWRAKEKTWFPEQFGKKSA